MERKLICGKPHVKRKCRGCGELVWARADVRTPSCDACYGYSSLPEVGNPHDDIPRSERTYERGGK
jgi:hypothetical protein